MSTNKEFGAALQSLLTEKKRSSADLMRFLESDGYKSSRGKPYDRSTISKWLSGSNAMPLSIIPSILDWLEIQPITRWGIYQLRSPNALFELQPFEGLKLKIQVIEIAYRIE